MHDLMYLYGTIACCALPSCCKDFRDGHHMFTLKPLRKDFIWKALLTSTFFGLQHANVDSESLVAIVLQKYMEQIDVIFTFDAFLLQFIFYINFGLITYLI